MQKVKYNFLTLKPLFLYSLFYSTILLGFYFNEDSLGGAKADFFYHYNISQKFSENFFLTYNLRINRWYERKNSRFLDIDFIFK